MWVTSPESAATAESRSEPPPFEIPAEWKTKAPAAAAERSKPVSAGGICTMRNGDKPHWQLFNMSRARLKYPDTFERDSKTLSGGPRSYKYFHYPDGKTLGVVVNFKAKNAAGVPLRLQSAGDIRKKDCSWKKGSLDLVYPR